MSVIARNYPATTAPEVRPDANALRLKRWLGPDWRLGFLFVLPIVVLVLALVAYPFCYAIYLSMTRKFVGMAPVFVGLENYIRLASDGFFQRAVLKRLQPGVEITFRECAVQGESAMLNQEEQGEEPQPPRRPIGTGKHAIPPSSPRQEVTAGLADLRFRGSEKLSRAPRPLSRRRLTA